jgi:hypothetical protein
MPKKWWFIVALVILGSVRLALPSIVKWKANQTLQELPSYKGHVGGVHLAMWRGACVLRDVEIEHKDGDFGLTIQKLSMNASWLHLLKRTWVGDIEVISPRLRILVKTPAKAPQEAVEKAKDLNQDVKEKTGKSLPDLLATLIPFKIRTFKLSDGTIRLQDHSLRLRTLLDKDKGTSAKDEAGSDEERTKEARISHLKIEARNLTNRAQLSSASFANVEASARLMNQGEFKLWLQLDPNAATPTFDLKTVVNNVELTEFNPMFRWQWGIDVKKGSFTMLSEANAKEGGFKGYVKPFIQDLEFLDAEQDKKKSLGKKIKEAIVDAASAILKNKDSKNIASRIPFEGRYDDPDPGIWEAVLTVLRNAFIQALSPHFERD